MRLSLFEESTRDMLISQTTTLPGIATPQSVVTNVDKVRSRGVELAWQKDNVVIRRLELFGSVTYVDAKIVSDPTFVSTTGTTATGKRVPNVPMWRATFGGTYRPNDNWALTLVGRYQSKIFATLDNIDTVQNVYQAFDPYLVFDTRVQYKVGERGSLALRHRQYHQREILPVPSVPAADLCGAGEGDVLSGRGYHHAADESAARKAATFRETRVIDRRIFVQGSLASGALLCAPQIARAEDWPARPVRFIVHLAAGGGLDFIARLVGEHVSRQIGQQVFVENRTGGGGVIGIDAAIKSPPDGYSLLVRTTTSRVHRMCCISIPTS